MAVPSDDEAGSGPNNVVPPSGFQRMARAATPDADTQPTISLRSLMSSAVDGAVPGSTRRPPASVQENARA